MARVLIVEDVPADARVIADACRRVDPSVSITTVGSSREAFAMIEANVYDLALVDIVLKGSRRTGQEVAQVAEAVGLPVIFVTGHEGLVPLHAEWVPKGNAAALTTALRERLGS